ncbi:PQQ-binding-like beta-propeller repeat protein [Haloarchaeobius sp. HME9146]|uniref:PQQ-binding-like beta-propeller repeat protein n=1 Tax=Haloarchaeobius sp. HME9146 TaxID=2978732 RepID=UPI0021C0DBED|nr:PQQ-binding-like beta-propeller repeat protein [Haloarchaeobius sp. HME9146]MCT9097040.1 PQQ-binding-like beta-propeller repeat protein [Haloarchaeobius sp. HME9146]
MNRRAFLGRLAAAGSLAALAGCNDLGGQANTLPSIGRAEGCGPYDPTIGGTAEWRSVGGDPAGTGVFPADSVPDTPLSVDWTFPIDGASGTTRPVVGDGRVYTHDFDSTVYAVDAETGESVWRQGITEPRGSPAVAADAVVVISEEHVVGFDPATGAELWTGPTGDPHSFNGSPVVADGIAYVPFGLSLYAIDVSDGTVRWKHTTGEETVGTPAITDGTVYYGDEDTYVYALDAATGAERWRYKTEAHVRCNVTVADGRVFTATWDGEVLGLDTTTGERSWSYRIGGVPELVASDGANTYVATDNRLYAFDPETGVACWSTGEYAGSYDSGLAVADGRVYVPTALTRQGSYTVPGILDAASGKLEWQLGQTPNADRLGFEMGPVVVDGAVYATGGGAKTLRLTRMS